MPLEYLKQTTFPIPTGYTIAKGAMTADSRRVYFAASHATQPKLLIYDMDGNRQEQQSLTSTSSQGTGHLMRSLIDAENLYLLSNSPATRCPGRCASVLKAGDRRQALFARRRTGRLGQPV